MTQDELKQAVAREAIKHVVDDAVIGVGTGSTANFFIEELARIKGRIAGAVASSDRSADRLKGHGIRLFELNSVNELPVYIDGADEITEHLAMIKGGGGALTREKIAPAELEATINNIAGVVTNGLFARRGADVLLLATKTGVRTIARK